MSIISGKKTTRKVQRNTRIAKPAQNKNIGLDEQIQEAKRLFSLLENPELLKQGR